MTNIYARQAASFRNELRTTCAALMGIVQGLLADSRLNDQEIVFLRDWLRGAESVSLTWPGSLIYAQAEEILSDGQVTEAEREQLAETLRQLLGGRLDEIAEAGYVSELPLDRVQQVDVTGKQFCFTGDFVFGPRSTCEEAIERRGGMVGTLTKKLDYLVVGGLGSHEWKHGSFGTKIAKAVLYRDGGCPIKIVHEDVWASSLSSVS